MPSNRKVADQLGLGAMGQHGRLFSVASPVATPEPVTFNLLGGLGLALQIGMKGPCGKAERRARELAKKPKPPYRPLPLVERIRRVEAGPIETTEGTGEGKQ